MHRLLSFLVLAISVLFIGKSLATPVTSTITAVDVLNRTVLIGQTSYKLADNIEIYSPAGSLLKHTRLKANQTITYWISYQSATPTITKIQINSGYNDAQAVKY